MHDMLSIRHPSPAHRPFSHFVPSADSYYLLGHVIEDPLPLPEHDVEAPSDLLGLLSVQAYDVTPEWSPEQRLQWEVLSDSWEILWGNICGISTQEKKRKELRTTQEWFDTRNADWPFALDGICLSLGINAEQLRKVMRARPCPRLPLFAGAPTSISAGKNPYRLRMTYQDQRQNHHRWRGEDEVSDTYLLPARQAA